MAELQQQIEYVELLDDTVYDENEQIITLAGVDNEEENVEFGEVREITYAEQMDDVALAGHTVFMHDGKQYIIPNELHENGQTIVFEEDDENEYIVEGQETEDIVIDEEQGEEDIQGYYTDGNDAETNTAELLDEAENSRQCYMLYRDDENDDNLVETPESLGKEYAVLKDGKLHIQSNEANKPEIHEKLQVLEESLNYEEQEMDVTGRNLITGQTISLNGFLEKLKRKSEGLKFDLHDDVLNSPAKRSRRTSISKDSKSETLQRPDYILIPPVNKRVVVGKTPDGKKIVGKILQIQKKIDPTILPKPKRRRPKIPEIPVEKVPKTKKAIMVNDNNEEEKIEEIIIDNTGKILYVENHLQDKIMKHKRMMLDKNIRKTLSGLMDLESIQKTLIDRNLTIKHIMKKSYNGTILPGKQILYHYGHMEKVEELDFFDRSRSSWVFVSDEKTEDEKAASAIDANENKDNQTIEMTNTSKATFGTLSDPELSDLYNISETNIKNSLSVTISVVVIEDENGRKKTKVMMPQGGPFQCEVCQKMFKTQKHLTKHVSVQHSNAKLNCSVCQKVFTDIHSLLRHHKTHAQTKNLSCDICTKNFTSLSAYQKHLKKHFADDNNEISLECSYCWEKFEDEESVQKHMETHAGMSLYQCEICYKTFVEESELNVHRKIHDPTKQFDCEVCGKVFNRHSNLLRHAEIHKVRDTGIKCELCGCQYNFISSLTRHIVNNHMNETIKKEPNEEESDEGHSSAIATYDV